MANKDPYELAKRFSRFLRVTDVTDGLDAVGRPDLTLMDPQIRPLWMGMRFWGPAVTMRVLPTNKPMPIVDKKDALRQHAIWREMGGWKGDLKPHIKPGCVIVTSTGGAKECGWWGSNNSMGMQADGRRRHRDRGPVPRHRRSHRAADPRGLPRDRPADHPGPHRAGSRCRPP